MLEELENKVYVLSELNEKLKAENEYLKQKCKQEYEGFMAVTHELCETSIELDKYKARNEKTINRCNYLLNNEKIIINDKEYIKQPADDYITQYIKEALNGDDEE